MPGPRDADLSALPSVDDVLRTAAAVPVIEQHGRHATVDAVRIALDGIRATVRRGDGILPNAGMVADLAGKSLAAQAKGSLRPVFNLTGTVLHTNLGRAILAEPAIDAAVEAMRAAVTLEYDLDRGRRGERDDHLRALLCALTGAEDATVVNNNAAAVLLALNSLSLGRETIVSRGELIEIGGAFRMPEIMARAGARMVEIGTTNRTHLRDYAQAIGAATGLIFKVHPSNYRIEGFTAEVPADRLAKLARERGVPMAHDLGSGTLIDLARLGLARETTVADAVSAGADLVTFSGDKLLGGPQAGFIVGRAALLAEINRNPLKRALRLDKVRLAALSATLHLYRDPDRLRERLPTLRLLTRPAAEIEAAARRIAPRLALALTPVFSVAVVPCGSQIGSGALPVETLASTALALSPTAKRHPGKALEILAAALRRLPIPVIGRVDQQALLLDLRCLEDERGFIDNLSRLDLSGREDGG